MRLDAGELLRGGAPGLIQDFGVDEYFADIVQKAPHRERLEALTLPSHLFCQNDGHDRHVDRVLKSVGIVRFDGVQTDENLLIHELIEETVDIGRK